MKYHSKHFVALINFLVLVPLVYFIPVLTAPYLPVNKLLHVGVNVAIIVSIISYIVMPWLMPKFMLILDFKHIKKKGRQTS